MFPEILSSFDPYHSLQVISKFGYYFQGARLFNNASQLEHVGRYLLWLASTARDRGNLVVGKLMKAAGNENASEVLTQFMSGATTENVSW